MIAQRTFKALQSNFAASRKSNRRRNQAGPGFRQNRNILRRLFTVAAMVVGATIGGGVSAGYAQNVDWVLNLNDTGFDPTVAGGTIQYSITVSNNGIANAPPTTISLTAPAGTSIVSATGTITGCAVIPSADGGTVTCTVPALAAFAADSASLTVGVQTSVSGTVSFSADVATGPGEAAADVGNNSATQTTTVTAGANLGMGISGPASAPAGSTVSYTLTATNSGPDPASNFTVQFPAPTGLTGIVPPAGCSLSAGTYSCLIAGPVGLGSSVSRVFTAQVSAGAGSTVTPLASVLPGTPPDPVSANNTATMNTTVTAGSDLSLGKSRSPSGSLLVGDTAVFTLSPSYTGDSPTGLTITDTVPANYAITSVTPSGGSGWSCTVGGQLVTCNRATGAGPGANVSLGTIAINADVISAGTAPATTNTATISASGPTDPNPANNTASDGGATINLPFVDLRANKSGPNPALVVVGNTYSFPVSATNVGNAPFYGTLVLTDNLPAGLSLTGYATNGWTCLPAASVGSPVAGPATVTCQRTYTAGSPLAAGATSPSVALQTLATASGSISNTVTVSSPDANLPDTNPANDTTSYSVTSFPGGAGGNYADISVSKTRANATVIAGDPQSFTIRVSNAGPQPSANITLTDDLVQLINNNAAAPTGSGLISVSVSDPLSTGMTCSTASTGGFSRRLTCTIPTLPAACGANCPEVTVQVRPGGEGGSRTNTADAISSTVADDNLANNAGSATFTLLPRADVTVTKAASPSPVPAGQDLTYVLTAQNLANGLSSAAGVSITDTLPSDVTFISASASCTTTPVAGSTTSPTNNQVVCNFGTIGNGAQQTATIVVRPNYVTYGIPAPGLRNSAAISTTTPETTTANNTTFVDTLVSPPSLDLLINKTESVDPVAVTHTTVFTITASNLGPSAAENVEVVDTMPAAGLQFLSHTVPADGVCSTVPAPNSFGGTLRCSFPLIPAGESRSITIDAVGVNKGAFANQATVSSDESLAGFDTNTANNSVSENTTVRTRADVAVTSKTPSADPVNLRDNFSFAIVVENNPDGLAALAEADNVQVSDSLPANMVLTGTPTVAAGPGVLTASTCTGAIGATSFTCDLGTMINGGLATITVPVEVISVSSRPQTFTNTATISTSSFDVNTLNDSNSGTVDISSSSISGNIFRDFNDDGLLTPGDTGIGGVSLTLNGTSFDGAPISVTVSTLPDGSYTFPFVPQGSYTISRGAVTEPYLTDSANNSAGTAGGTPTNPTTISAITLGADTLATGYLFPLVPTARIGIAKDLFSGPTENPDGSFNAGFRLRVTNFSLEALNSVLVTDAIASPAQNFGTHVALANPATDPMTPGSYTIAAAPSGTCGGTNSGFDGSADQTVASGFTIAAGASCLIDFTIRVQPVVPVPPPGTYLNQAVVTGSGALSGQTSATNPQLQDLSDFGATADPNNNGQANEAGENDPTPVSPVYSPSIALVKTADISGLSNPPLAGETINYSFTVTNTGGLNLSNVTLSDPLPGIVLSGGPIANLPAAPGPGNVDSTTFTATYAISQADINLGTVTNQATVTGTDPFGAPSTDLSGTTNGDDNPLVTALTQTPAITLVKTATPAFSNPVAVGDTIAYDFAITNAGNVTLTNITLTDILPGIVISGGPIASLAPGATDGPTGSGPGTFTALYTLTQADIDAGQVTNQATATGTPPSGPAVSDLSGSAAANDNPTVVPVAQSPSIQLVKTVDSTDFDDGPDPGDVLRYSFTVTNTGNVTLAGVTLADPLPGLVLSGGPIASLPAAPGPGNVDSTTFTATYTPTAADISTGQVNNTATVTGNYGPGGTLSVSDSDSAVGTVVSVSANPETFPPFATDGGTTTSVLASDTERGSPATLATVTINVIAQDPGVTLDPLSGLITLAPGNPAGDYTVTYEICSVIVPTVCDQTTETVNQLPIIALEATKTQILVDNGDGIDGVGDRLDYTITVENLSNVPLTNITLSDVFQTLAGTPLALDSGPTFTLASMGSLVGDLQIGETATYVASHVFTVLSVTEGGVSNSVTANALPVFGPGVIGTPAPISDVSDNGVDTDGNTTDDPTIYRINSSLAPTGLRVTKTTPRGIVERGSVVPYTITIRNTNPVVSGQLNILDVLPPGFLYVTNSAMLDGNPAAVRVQGRVVTWRNVPVPPLTTVIATLSARVTDSAKPGEHVNVATLRNPATNALLAKQATATVRILPEAVFDCGDVIGKVFDDKNRDGYQNDPANNEETGTQPEPGIPAVRLAGVDGTIITTDQFGRFHVPCAMLPADKGSNFILKLDTRTLPTGYRLTTENPRVVRLTPGKLTEMNFGAAITRVVRIDLNARAFVVEQNGRTTLAPGLEQGIARLLPQIEAEAANVRLAFHLPKDAGPQDVAHARALMRLVQEHIDDVWRGNGQVKLTIEQTLVRVEE